jgi:hypothetical protein
MAAILRGFGFLRVSCCKNGSRVGVVDSYTQATVIRTIEGHMPSYVFVWENNTFGHEKVFGYNWPGHATMNISDQFYEPDVPVGQLSYVSWWPGPEGAKFSVFGALFGKNSKGENKLSLISDVRAEGYLPDHVIEMASTPEQEDRMRAEWKAVLLKEGGSSYRSLRKNCSTICSRVLHAGGFYARKWAVDNNFTWSPADIRRLAVAAGGRMLLWDEFLVILKEKSFLDATVFTRQNGTVIDHARSGVYCSTGVECEHQRNQKWQPDKGMR